MTVNIQDDILRLHSMGLLDRLLQDKATKGKVLWATDAYSRFGDCYTPGNEIRPQRITGEHSDLIKTRARRAMEQRTARTRQHAEVFTPLWVVKKMNDVADEQWFGRKTGFYQLTEEGKIAFTNNQKHWKLYVDARRLEITCGEAPFLATRYDVETGEALPVEERIGLLDRKLRVVSENAADLAEWKTWALRAVQSIYGYELQGDNLLIDRVNVLCSVEEHMMHRWKRKPEKAWLEKLCNVVCWNLWQMDGITGCVPVPPQPTEQQLSLFPPEPQFEQESLFGETKKANIGCRLFDWRGDRSVSYQALREKGSELMKFDFIIGNPPYQEETEGTSDIPVYNDFMDAAYDIGKKVELITPARFLFDAGKTPKVWNQKMLNDPHLKILYYFQDAQVIFPSNLINGGIVITYHDLDSDYGATGFFSQFAELNKILKKVKRIESGKALDSIISQQNKWNLDALYTDYPEYKSLIGSNGREKRLTTSIFSSLSVFHEEMQPEDTAILGLINGKRCFRYIPTKYLENSHLSFDKWKVIISSGDGAAGTIGLPIPARVSGVPSVLEPYKGYTQTFIGFGAYETEAEANALTKYLKTKFARTMLATLKVTQHNHKDTWANVPLQDFTPASDIDWSRSIPEIDRQLYAKYGLDAAEIEFIETHVKPME